MIALLLRLLSRFDRDRPDTAWRATGYTLTTEAHYDYGKARAGFLRARGQSETGRKLTKPRPVTRKDNVTVMRRKQGKRPRPTHCRMGHALVPGNLTGKLQRCSICNRRVSQKAKKAARERAAVARAMAGVRDAE